MTFSEYGSIRNIYIIGGLVVTILFAVFVIIVAIDLPSTAQRITWTEIEAPLNTLQCWTSKWGVWCERIAK